MSEDQKDRLLMDIYKLHIPDKVFRYDGMPEVKKDFIQHCYLQLLELAPEKFEDLANQGQLINYFFMMCKRLAHPSSAFWILHKGKIKLDFYGTYDDIEREAYEDFE